MLPKDGTVLDLGCGTGRFSEAFSTCSSQVIGTDLSTDMIAFAEQRRQEKGLANVSYLCTDWHNADIDVLGWREKFDLVFAYNTPAVQSYDTFHKMRECSRGWCFMSKPIRWKDSLILKLVEYLGLINEYRVFDEDMRYAFDVLFQEGYSPKISYQYTTFDYYNTLEKACEYFIKRIGMKCALTHEQENIIRQYLETIAVNGMIETKHETTLAMLWWNNSVEYKWNEGNCNES